MSSPAKEVFDRLRKELEAGGVAFSDLDKWRDEIGRAHAAAVAEAERACAAATTEAERAHAAASTEAELVLCLFMFKQLLDISERYVAEHLPDDSEHFSKLRDAGQKWYLTLVLHEASIYSTDGYFRPDALAAILTREVAAGRLSPDNELYKNCLLQARMQARLVARRERLRALLIPPRTTSQVGMAARLGVVLYWAGTLVACLIAGLIAFAVLFGTGKGDPFLLGLGLFVAAAIWLIGRATCYVLAGR